MFKCNNVLHNAYVCTHIAVPKRSVDDVHSFLKCPWFRVSVIPCCPACSDSSLFFSMKLPQMTKDKKNYIWPWFTYSSNLYCRKMLFSNLESILVVFAKTNMFTLLKASHKRKYAFNLEYLLWLHKWLSHYLFTVFSSSLTRHDFFSFFFF